MCIFAELTQRCWILITRGMIKKTTREFLNYRMTKLNAMSKEIAPYMRGIMTMVILKNTGVKLSWESSFNTEAHC